MFRGVPINLVKRTWTFISVLSCVLVVILSYRMYAHSRQIRTTEIQDYNQWMNEMQGVVMNLHSKGLGEKTTVKNPTMYQNPNMAMIEAEKWNSMAGTYANGISSVTNGQMSNVFGEMAMVNSTMGNELDMMIDKGNYVGGTYEFTVPRKVSVADRDFMYSQITNLVLKGMPATVKNVGQINDQSDHLRQLLDGNSKVFGVFSDAFIKFMKGTGQFR